MLAVEIKQKAIRLGYASCGIIPATTFGEYKRYLSERARTFPQSEELYQSFYSFAQPPESGKSIIVCLQGSSQYKLPESLRGAVGRHYLFDSRLAWSYEYRAKKEFETYLGTRKINILGSDLPVRWAAARAGIGKFGRNNFIYSPEHGSYIVIDAWVVDREIEYDAAPESFTLPRCSENCLRCVRACPTGAMSDPFSMDYGRCVAHLSFNTTGIPDEALRSQMGPWLYGCDACQDVCPINKGKSAGSEDFPLLSQYEEYLQPERLLTMDEDTYANIVNPRFWYCGEDGLWLWRHNALRVMINSGSAEYHRLIRECCEHADTRLRELAQWGCRRLGI